MNVLVVDDNHDYLKLLTKAFKHNNHQVTAVDNGQQAIEALDNQTFDLAVLDMHLIGNNGAELVHELKSYQDTLNVEVVIYSSYANYLPQDLVAKVKIYDKSKFTPKQLVKNLA